MVVDSLGNLLHVEVYRANEPDIRSACRMLERSQEGYPTVRIFSGDSEYLGIRSYHLSMGL